MEIIPLWEWRTWNCPSVGLLLVKLPTSGGSVISQQAEQKNLLSLNQGVLLPGISPKSSYKMLPSRWFRSSTGRGFFCPPVDDRREKTLTQFCLIFCNSALPPKKEKNKVFSFLRDQFLELKKK